MKSRTTNQGTAMSEASLCESHFREPYISNANKWANLADDVGDDIWRDSSGNEYICCVECGNRE